MRGTDRNREQDLVLMTDLADLSLLSRGESQMLPRHIKQGTHYTLHGVTGIFKLGWRRA